MSDPTIVGIDIGGANLKYADTAGRSYSRPFAMWKRWEELSVALQADLGGHFPDAQALAVTITGELADCFIDRMQGISHISEHANSAARELRIPELKFYCVDGQFVSFPEVQEHAEQIAAANWHALGSFVGKTLAPFGTIVDVGSTTTDLVPLRDGRVATEAKTDFDRLCEGSLVYVGCRRTPVCSLVSQLRYEDRVVPVMKELFATIDDARLVLEYQEERADDQDTADGAPRTRAMARNRLARMVGLDHHIVGNTGAQEMAEQIWRAARESIHRSANRLVDREFPVVVCGHGDDLVPLAEGTTMIRLADRIGESASRCAPSYAVAHLSREVFQQDNGA